VTPNKRFDSDYQDVVIIIKGEYFMYGYTKGRKSMSPKKGARQFKRVAQYVHPLNVHNAPMRGGFRI